MNLYGHSSQAVPICAKVIRFTALLAVEQRPCRSQSDALHPSYSTIHQSDFDASRVVSSRQAFGDDALHLAACRLIRLENDGHGCAWLYGAASRWDVGASS